MSVQDPSGLFRNVQGAEVLRLLVGIVAEDLRFDLGKQAVGVSLMQLETPPGRRYLRVSGQ